MDWYYAKNGEPATGPFDDAKFAELVQNGTVQGTTLVWNPIIKEWVPCRQVYPAAGGPAASAAAPVPSISNLLTCPNCRSILPWQWQDEARSSQATVTCPGCRMGIETLVFPALHAKIQSGRSADKMVLDGDATCYNHLAAKAEVVCSHCGRFLCALCDMELAGVHSCPSCLAVPKNRSPKAGTSELADKLEQRRFRYDQMALALAMLGFALCWTGAGIVLGPLAIIAAIKGLRRPGSLLGKSPWKLWAAIVVATLDLLILVGFIILIIADN